MITLQVEDRLFRLPSNLFFKESPEFCEMYKLSAHVQVSAGYGDPIKLEMVTKKEFLCLLETLYPL
jgi:hypothetical protein